MGCCLPKRISPEYVAISKIPEIPPEAHVPFKRRWLNAGTVLEHVKGTSNLDKAARVAHNALSAELGENFCGGCGTGLLWAKVVPDQGPDQGKTNEKRLLYAAAHVYEPPATDVLLVTLCTSCNVGRKQIILKNNMLATEVGRNVLLK